MIEYNDIIMLIILSALVNGVIFLVLLGVALYFAFLQSRNVSLQTKMEMLEVTSEIKNQGQTWEARISKMINRAERLFAEAQSLVGGGSDDLLKVLASTFIQSFMNKQAAPTQQQQPVDDGQLTKQQIDEARAYLDEKEAELTQ